MLVRKHVPNSPLVSWSFQDLQARASDEDENAFVHDAAKQSLNRQWHDQDGPKQKIGWSCLIHWQPAGRSPMCDWKRMKPREVDHLSLTTTFLAMVATQPSEVFELLFPYVSCHQWCHYIRFFRVCSTMSSAGKFISRARHGRRREQDPLLWNPRNWFCFDLGSTKSRKFGLGSIIWFDLGWNF